MANAVEVRGVSKRFRLHHDKSFKERVVSLGRSTREEFDALQNVDLDIAVGSTVGLLGHNGSGKSTLLNAVAGTFLVDMGRINLAGVRRERPTDAADVDVLECDPP